MRFIEFKNSDYEIHDRKHLDKYLVELCNKIIEGQQTDPDMYGMVAACVLDNDHNIVSSTSTKENGKWKHAERNAIEAYNKTHGEIPEGSIIITTLSPCDGPMADRYQGSCTDLINNSPVKKVYCGYMDPSQHDEDFEFTVESTANKDIQGLCKKFADTFLGDEDHPIEECGGTGVVASKKQAKDPRYSMSLTKDVRPGQIEKNLKAFSLAQENFTNDKTLDPDIYGEELPISTVKHIVSNVMHQVDPGAKVSVKSSPEGYYIVRSEGLRLDFGITAAGGEISANIVNAYSSYPGQGVVTNIFGQCFKAAEQLWGKPNRFVMSAQQDRGHGVWQHIAQKLGAEWEGSVMENFADGQGPGRPGDSVRHGIPKGATMAQLEKASHAKGRKGQLARWQLNMRRGKKK